MEARLTMRLSKEEQEQIRRFAELNRESVSHLMKESTLYTVQGRREEVNYRVKQLEREVKMLRRQLALVEF